MYISKLDPINTLSKITYNITLNQGELSTINKNQRNIDVIEKSNIDSEELRRKIQLENEEVYGINIILTFFSKDISNIYKIISRYRAKLYSKGIGVEITNFRHLEFYLSNLPLGIKNNFIQNNLIINTSALSNIFPFYTENIMDLNGIQFGITKLNRRICMVDIFSKKYENSNICVLGASGSGKSYFTKLCILRNYFQNKIQIVLDVENEYYNLCNNLGGCNLFGDLDFNIFQISKKDIQVENFLDEKIDKILNFLKSIMDIKIEEESLKKEIKMLYKSFGITEDINTLFRKEEKGVVTLDNEIISENKFPTLTDLKEKTKYKTLKKVLEENSNSILKYFYGTNKVNLNSKLFVLNMSHFRSNKDVLVRILEYIKEQIPQEKEIIIYIDELFKYCKFEEVLEIITDMYKSIRKRRGSIVTITQDITDFFKYKDGYYANSILNNSCFKLLFKTEYEDSNILRKIIKIEEEKISSLKKGEAYFLINRNNIKLQVVANEYERILLNENDYSN